MSWPSFWSDKFLLKGGESETITNTTEKSEAILRRQGGKYGTFPISRVGSALECSSPRRFKFMYHLVPYGSRNKPEGLLVFLPHVENKFFCACIIFFFLFQKPTFTKF
ncbi:unnamed protein product [Ixodes pacificus]